MNSPAPTPSSGKGDEEGKGVKEEQTPPPSARKKKGKLAGKFEILS